MTTPYYFWQNNVIHDKRRLRGKRQHYKSHGKTTLYMTNLGCMIYENTTLFLANFIIHDKLRLRGT